jgi:hypothetical protein
VRTHPTRTSQRDARAVLDLIEACPGRHDGHNVLQVGCGPGSCEQSTSRNCCPEHASTRFALPTPARREFTSRAGPAEGPDQPGTRHCGVVSRRGRGPGEVSRKADWGVVGLRSSRICLHDHRLKFSRWCCVVESDRGSPVGQVHLFSCQCGQLVSACVRGILMEAVCILVWSAQH